MPIFQRCKSFVFQMMVEVFNLDFIMQPWIVSYGVVLGKGIRVLIQKNDDTLVGMPWSSSMQYWNWVVISTSRGIEKLLIPEAICDCVETGNRIPIEVQTSFLFNKRTRIRLAREKRIKQPA